MGNTDSQQRLGERVLAAKAKLQQDKEITSQRYEYLKANSADILDVMIDGISDSFSSFSPFLEATLLISWMYDSKRCEKIILNACTKILSAPINKTQYQWFQQYLFSSSIWMFKSQQNKYMYQELLSIAKNMSHDIIDSMDSIYEHLEGHKKWKEMMNITNISYIQRQDHVNVGLLKQKAFKDTFERKTNDEKSEEMKSFIDSNVAINILTSTATNINNEFQTHVKTVMSRYGKVQSGPIKKVERCVSKLENDYQDANYPKCAKLLDLVRCSVTFNTVNQLIGGYNGLMKHISNNNGTIELARVKNGFRDKAQGGYRDIKVNVIYKSEINPSLNMICEIQLLLINYLEEKKRIHKLYSIMREEIYFQMIVQKEPVIKEGVRDKGLGDSKFVDLLNVDKEVALNDIPQTINKCSVDPDLGLLCMEGVNWFGIIDINTKKRILEQRRDAPIHPWYARNSHQWMTINQQKHLSIQTKKNEINFFKITPQNKFIEDETFRITIANDSTINYVDWDRKFETILLCVDDTTLQKRSIKDVNRIIDRIKLEEQINQSSFHNLRLSDDGSMCCLGGGAYKNYFYLIDIKKKEQYKMTSNVLSDTYAPCFINDETKYISVGDKKGRIEIWDIHKKQAVNTMSIGATKWITSAASTNNILAIGSMDKKLRLYDVRNWQCFYEKDLDTEPTSLHLTTDSKYLTLGGRSGALCYVLRIE